MMLIERSEKLGKTCNKELQIKNQTKKKVYEKKEARRNNGFQSRGKK